MNRIPVRRSLLVVACVLAAVASWGADWSYAYTGRMDADSITVSSQASGLIESLSVDEGDTVRKGAALCQINTDRLKAQKRQQEAQLEELAVKLDSTSAQIQQADAQISQAQAQVEQAQAQLDLAQDTLARTEKILASGGATQQSRDQLASQLSVDKANLSAAQSSLKAAQSNVQALKADLRLISAQQKEQRAAIQLTDIALQQAKILSPLDGIVLTRFHGQGELAVVGTPLLELADLSTLTVEIYVPLSQLGAITLGKKATISADGVRQGLQGTVSWIASESEFTPKTILTQETRTTLVYGVRVRVANPAGILKVGMPVEVRF